MTGVLQESEEYESLGQVFDFAKQEISSDGHLYDGSIINLENQVK